MSEYRVLITGSRDWRDRTEVFGQLDDLLREHHTLTVVHGACKTGGDEIAHEWLTRAYRASELGTATEEAHPADWGRHGKRAGTIRNDEMVALGANLCVAFILPCRKAGCGGREPHDSHGTGHCVSRARAAGIPVRRIDGHAAT